MFFILICLSLCQIILMEGTDEPEIGIRLGLLASTHLGLSPTGESRDLPPRSLCCCSPLALCPIIKEGVDYDDYFDQDLVSSGIIDARNTPSVGIRIANQPLVESPEISETVSSCPLGHTLCCFKNVKSLNSIAGSCVKPSVIPVGPPWSESCPPLLPKIPGKQCGTRSYYTVPSLKHGEASPEEFPWACLLLNQNNDFIGSCAIIPSNFNNDISKGTYHVITAAHKLAVLKEADKLKVRVLEYDASGFKEPEKSRHEEFTVVKFLVHPSFSPTRLSNDIALLTVDRPINLLSSFGVNAACLPSCQEMFSQTFENGTGTRCWTSGWGKDSIDGKFQAIMHKVDLPLVRDDICQNLLKVALSAKNPSAGAKFILSPSEICAGGEAGKDACSGDGGSPLVCLSTTGHWHIVGLVTWGIGCAQHEVPGVYTKISYFKNWLEQNMG